MTSVPISSNAVAASCRTSKSSNSNLFNDPFSKPRCNYNQYGQEIRTMRMKPPRAFKVNAGSKPLTNSTAKMRTARQGLIL